MYILLLRESERDKNSKISIKMIMKKMNENSVNLPLDSKYPKNMRESGIKSISIMVFCDYFIVEIWMMFQKLIKIN